MKRTNKAMFAIVTALGVASGCAPSSESGVVASLTMTGSSQGSTLARYKMQPPLINFILPAAVALTPPAMTDATGSNVTLNRAWIVVKEIEFKATEVGDAAEGADIEFKGPYVVDLLSAAPNSFGSATVPTGTYRRIKMKLESAGVLPADAPVQLQNNSIYLEGTVGGNQISYSSHDGTEFKISGSGGVNIADNSNVLVTIKMADLFKMISFADVTGTVAISENNRVPTASNRCPLIDSSAMDLYTCFRVGMEKAGKFGKDDDGDHEIEAGEDEVHD